MSYYLERQLVAHRGLSIEVSLHRLKIHFLESLLTLRGLHTLFSAHPVIFEHSTVSGAVSTELADPLEIQ